MESIFLKILNMSITAGWLTLAVIILRLLLRKAPKAIAVVLWALVGLRLVLPFTFESSASLVPSSEPVPQSILYEQTPAIHTGLPLVNSTVNPVISQSMAPQPGASVNPMQVAAAIGAQIWIVGMVVMLGYLLVSYLRLRHRVREAVLLTDRVWIGDHVSSPFILGIVRPRIYLPSSLAGQDQDFVIAHERAHLMRKDHWWKPLGFLLLSIHWFNPLLWVGYILLCRDIELACDEKVIRKLGSDAKKPYSETLLRCSVKRSAVTACPLAFGEVGVRQRIKSILHYKKPALWILIVAIVVTTVLAVGFLTDPKSDPEPAETTATEPPTTNPPTVSTEPSDTTISPPVFTSPLQKKYPQYFDLPTDKGLEVYVWQMGKGLYSWGLLPGRNLSYELTELMELHLHSATTEEMRAIVASYGLPRSMVTIIPFHMPYSSYYYEINDQYIKEVESLFWQEKLVDTTVDTLNFTHFDIDADGVVEECFLGNGPTSGLFTFTFTALEEGKPKYFNIFRSEFYYLSFIQNSDGTMLLKGVTQGQDPQTHYFDISIVDGNIQLTENDQTLEYWGEQGLDSPFAAVNDNTIDNAIAQILQEQYKAVKPDGLLHVQSYFSLSSETVSGTPTADGGENVSLTTVYLMVMHCTYNISTGTPEAITAEITPAVMELKRTGEDCYELVRYQVPTEETGLDTLFPSYLVSRAKQTSRYEAELRAQCEQIAQSKCAISSR